MPDSMRSLTTHSRVGRLVAGLLIGLVLVGLDVARRTPLAPMAQAAWPVAGTLKAPVGLVLTGQGRIPMPADTPAAHASSLLAMPGAHPASVMAFWFAGTRESAPDVQIAASQFDRATQRWRAARFVVNRHALGGQLGFGVRRLGNPVAWLDKQGQIHLFVVATGLGGWAASRVVHLRQANPGQDFEALVFDVARVLPLSWLWNTSFLVRSAPLALEDGGMVMPVHFELGLKYPVSLRFDAQGNFKGMAHMSQRLHLLQPTLLIQSESHWLALLRDHSPAGKVAATQTRDGGKTWTDLPDLSLNNPDASIAGLTLSPGHMVLAHNSSFHARNILDLSVSSDGQTWVKDKALALGSGGDEFSYPAMVWTEGALWVSFTDQRKSIAWQRYASTSKFQ
jgi:predicted neuraminidase